MSRRDRYEPGVPCWVTAMQPDVDAAAQYYGRLFGWEYRDSDGFLTATLRGRDVASVAPLAPGVEPPPAPDWLTQISVDSAEGTAEKAEAAGGRVVAGVLEFEIGRLVVIEDPGGAVFNAWEPRTRHGAQLVNEPGAWAMSRLDTPDPERAAAFYGELFGWELENVMPAGSPQYYIARLGGKDVGAVSALPPDAPESAAWNTYVWVDSADETAAKARAAGGTIVAEPFDSLDGGRMAVIADPGGAVVAVWELGEHRGAQLVNEPGAWSMSMLSTPDTETAAAFYGEVFGWSTDSFGDFMMFRLEGYVGGEPTQPVPRDVIAVMAPGEQAAWTPDFWVADADAAAARAGELGGQVVMGPFDTPVGRTAVLADPVGAVFSVSKVGPAT